MRTATLVLVSLLLLSACSNSKVTSSWKGPGAASLAPGNKILVLGIIREKDIRLRMQMEGFLVDALKAKGYNAVSAYTLYGPKMFSNKEEEAVLNQLRNSGIDEVFTITLLDRARERNFQPASMYPWESNLYDVNSKKLLYSVQSQSTNPSSAGSMGKDYSKAVVKNMIKNGILPKK
jgi:hypothetical protein